MSDEPKEEPETLQASTAKLTVLTVSNDIYILVEECERVLIPLR